jgi:hypothetical protein
VYWAEDPYVQQYGFAQDPNVTLVTYILREVDGQWLIDEQDIPICFGDCDSLFGTATPAPASTPISTPKD